jgi:Fe-S-cluster-containing dehydrogenase component/anaerobic selenocysteine-containing dehydrogenase
MQDPNPKLHRIRARSASQEEELSRRQFLQLMAASTAALAAGCQPNPPEQIMPYVTRPADIVPGQPTVYATSWLHDGYATGLLVQTREGRPIKVEGNPVHPASLGGTSAFHQAAVLQLYDPDRAQAVLQRGVPAEAGELERMLSADREDHGAGLRLLLEPTSSALVLALVQQVKQRFPASKVTFYAPLAGAAPGVHGTQLFGRDAASRYDLARAKLIASFDADLLSTAYDLRYARDFAAQRHLSRPADDLSRLYAVEAPLTITGSVADHRLGRSSQRTGVLLAALSGRVLPQGSLPAQPMAAIDGRLDAEERRFLDALARDLRQRPRGETLIIAGGRQPLEVHALCHALNEHLGNLGSTLQYAQSAVAPGSGDIDLAGLVGEMAAGKVESLLVLGANPAYTAAADLDWSGALRKVASFVCAGLYRDETALDAHWFVPLSHPFEAWGDGRAYDGTLSYVQPLIRPLYATKTITELLSMLAGAPLGDRAQLRVRFGERFGEGLSVLMGEAERVARERPEVSAGFHAALSRGFIAGSAFAPLSVTLRTGLAAQALNKLALQPTAAGIEINFLASPTLHDGRYANLSWLLELPDPIMKLAWDNAALMSPKTGAKLGIPDALPGDDDEYPVVELRRAGRTLRAPVLFVPGHADDAVTLWLGYGREGSEKLAREVGVNAYRLRTRDAEQFANDLQVHALTERYPLAIDQPHRDMRGRPIALSTTLAHYRGNSEFTAEHKGPLPSLLPEIALPGPQWAMTIDLSMCTGCSACVVACQAENNLMVVGKEQARKKRTMHWLRIDAYPAPDNPERIVHQPMLCQHCENAPCEYVCPVNATVHSPDGLNEMVYNRCIGTRFCSNNCPYKVRRFNWFNWMSHEEANTGSVALQRNPEVSVRERGVMEKCTYCVQRIRAAEINARNEQREIRSGEVVTACQQACATRAISFGSLTHEASTMVQWRNQARSYEVLHETGARPRTMYLARIENPNPELG